MTPEEIVALIGNIGNRPDIREVQEKQVEEIYKLVKEFEDIAKIWMDSYRDMEREYKIKLANAKQTIEQLEEELEDGKVSSRS